jgi:SAM-dependent methyltransferase
METSTGMVHFQEHRSSDAGSGSVTNSNSAAGNPNDRHQQALSPRDLFDLVYDDLSVQDIQRISQQERKQNGYTTSTLSYGDMEFEDMGNIFDVMELNGFICGRHSHFVDIGCGAGKPLFVAALLYKFESVEGIEILSGLVDVCQSRISKWTKLCAQRKLRRLSQQDIRVTCGDALRLDWQHATAVFMHATAFDEDMMHQFKQKLDQLAPHSFVVIVSKKVESRFLIYVESVDVNLSWGSSQAHIYVRSEEIYVPEGATTTDNEFLLSFGINAVANS